MVVRQAIRTFMTTLIALACILFIPAGTLTYPNGWLFIILLTVPMAAVGIWLLIVNPELLAKRLESKEGQEEQQRVVRFGSFITLGGMILGALDFRYGWTTVPRWVVTLASLIFLAGYLFWVVVLRENASLMRTVAVEEGQRVIDTGPYRVVRHPMYTATLPIFLATPLILGSCVALIPFLFHPVVLVMRIRHEETLLIRELKGYAEYCSRVRYRLIPFLW
jgi:protein-S-isoprenylcysteine O-methyltransferase Ste14